MKGGTKGLGARRRGLYRGGRVVFGCHSGRVLAAAPSPSGFYWMYLVEVESGRRGLRGLRGHYSGTRFIPSLLYGEGGMFGPLKRMAWLFSDEFLLVEVPMPGRRRGLPVLGGIDSPIARAAVSRGGGGRTARLLARVCGGGDFCENGKSG